MNKKSYLFRVSIGILALLGAFAAVSVRFDIPAGEMKARYAKPNSRFIEVQGLPVHCVDEGKGFPLLLIHGTASSLLTWDEWARALSGHYRVIRLDIPAYGLTGPNKNNDYSIDTYVSFIRSFLDTMGVKRCHIAGNSLGGAIAWNFAAVHPDMVDKLILIDAGGYPRKKKPPFVFRLARLPVLNRVGRYISPRFLVKKSLLEVYGDDSKVTKELIDRHCDLALREGNRDAFIARSVKVNVSDTSRLKKVKAPTLIMWGSLDEWIPPEDAQNFRRDIAGSRLIIYPGAGHVPMEEIPVETAADALAFLTGAVK
jgi:pimeloyl-ACP methyl ester carboxylesterase